MEALVILYSLSLISAVSCQSTFNVLSYGAIGDGNTNDTMAFVKAWGDTCSNADSPTMIIPDGKAFLVYPTSFKGPCVSSNININLSGNIEAPKDPNEWEENYHEQPWLGFYRVNGLNIIGQGQLIGHGSGWWDCRRLNPGNATCNCTNISPPSLHFGYCTNLRMSNISIVQSPGVHIAVFASKNISLEWLHLNSPETSPNTDGIHMELSQNVSIYQSDIRVGDDCVSIGDQCFNINVSHVDCGPGHGMSVGSLGAKGEVVDVQNISVSYVNFYNTTNGGRIKTWEEGRGQVRNIRFSNMNFTEVKNPIIIDQYYGADPGPKMINGVKISEVYYTNFYGTSASEVAINLNCSDKVACTNLSLENVELTSADSGKDVISSCNNAYGDTTGVVQPKSCLLQ